MTKRNKYVMLILIVLLSIILDNCSEFPVLAQIEYSRETDSLALIASKDANPSSLLYWNYTTPIDSWEGVTVRNGRVEELHFTYLYSGCSNDHYLMGYGLDSLPSEIGNLTNLTYIDISLNGLTSVPSEIVKLTNLESFYANNNKFTAEQIVDYKTKFSYVSDLRL